MGTFENGKWKMENIRKWKMGKKRMAFFHFANVSHLFSFIFHFQMFSIFPCSIFHFSNLFHISNLFGPDNLPASRSPRGPWSPPDRFVSCVMVWAAGVKVAGRAPQVAFLSQMCECACNAFAHSLARNLPLVGLEPGPMALKSGPLPISKKKTAS